MPLGRGLNALISTNKKTDSSVVSGEGLKNKVWQIPIDDIETNVKQPRQYFDETALFELRDSIKEHGILQPLLVVEKPNGGYELIAGERRLRAAKLAGLTTVPALVRYFEEQQKLEVALIENIQRENLNPLEEAFSYQRLIDEFGLTQQEVAQKVGKSRSAVANTIRLLDLPKEAKIALEHGKISAGQARAILSLKTEAEMLSALKSTLGEKITVREMEQNARKKINKIDSKKDPNITYLEGKLRTALGAKVSITERNGKGNINIFFHDLGELRGLVENISE